MTGTLKRKKQSVSQTKGKNQNIMWESDGYTLDISQT